MSIIIYMIPLLSTPILWQPTNGMRGNHVNTRYFGPLV